MNYIQNMTSAEALANLNPYDDVNRNSTVGMFYDSSDGNKLKGVFFDDNVVGDKVIRDFSSGQSNGVFRNQINVIISKAEVNTLDTVPKIISRAQLGLLATEGAIFDISNVIWKINDDGVPFSTVGGRIDINNGLFERLNILTEVEIENVGIKKINVQATGSQTVDINPANDGLKFTATVLINGGGQNSIIEATLFYKKITI